MRGKMAQKVASLHAPSSDLDGDGFSSSGAADTPLGKFTINLENIVKGFFEIPPHFGESLSLSIDTRNFFYPGDIPSPALLNHGGEFAVHAIILT